MSDEVVGVDCLPIQHRIHKNYSFTVPEGNVLIETL